MDKKNPAVYECKKSHRAGMHWWMRTDTGTAWCKNCGVELTLEQAADCFRDTERH